MDTDQGDPTQNSHAPGPHRIRACELQRDPPPPSVGKRWAGHRDEGEPELGPWHGPQVFHVPPKGG